MSVLPKLASSLNRRDEVPNQELAKVIAKKGDKAAVKELVENLRNKSIDIRHDCIKALYETGSLAPVLLSPYTKEFVAHLESKSNRMQWGAMTALAEIVREDPKAIYAALPKIIAAAEKGSVITNDQYVYILQRLATHKAYNKNAIDLLLEQLRKSPTNQLPRYAEDSLPLITPGNKAQFVKTLTPRLKEMDTESKRKRLEKVLKKLEK